MSNTPLRTHTPLGTTDTVAEGFCLLDRRAALTGDGRKEAERRQGGRLKDSKEMAEKRQEKRLKIGGETTKG